MRAIFDNIALGWNQINILLDKTKASNPMWNKECQETSEVFINITWYIASEEVPLPPFYNYFIT